MEKSMSGLAFAAASVASPSRKPTVVIWLQSCWTRASMLSAYSESDCDSISAVVTPRLVLAFTRPSCEVWLNDLSSKPPESETMQALKSGYNSAGVDADGVSEGVSLLLVSPRSPQLASVSAATLMSAATRVVLFTAPPTFES